MRRGDRDLVFILVASCRVVVGLVPEPLLQAMDPLDESLQDISLGAAFLGYGI